MGEARRPRLEDLDLSAGKRARLWRLLHGAGPGNGTILVLPVDQGLEHGPIDFFANPEALNPEFQLRLAAEGGYSAVAFQVGIAEKYMRAYLGRVPLVLKLNGKTNIPPDDPPFSPLNASVEDAVRLGAEAVGYTLYVGSPAQDRDFQQLAGVRRDCERYGMPLIVWAYPRGKAVESKGGRDGLYAVDYAARVADELGADMVKLNVPKLDPERAPDAPGPYKTLRLETLEAIRKVVRSAGRALTIFSGGEKLEDAALLEKARLCMEGGASGLIFGRNIWQRPYDEALRITHQIQAVMKAHAA